MADRLVEFLRTKREQSAGYEQDWQPKKNLWVKSVKNLYKLIQDMLRPSIESGDVTIREFDIEIDETFVGKYSIPALELRVGGERVDFVPKGLIVIVASGRVDIRGERDSVTLIRKEKDGDTEWEVVLQRVPRLQVAQLNRELLEYALERVMLPLA
jgi:hypothetical protein